MGTYSFTKQNLSQKIFAHPQIDLFLIFGTNSIIKQAELAEKRESSEEEKPKNETKEQEMNEIKE